MLIDGAVYRVKYLKIFFSRHPVAETYVYRRISEFLDAHMRCRVFAYLFEILQVFFTIFMAAA